MKSIIAKLPLAFWFAALNLPVMLSAQSSITSHLEIYDLEKNSRTVVHSEAERFEAPNWTSNGKHLIINRKGLLYRVSVKGGKPKVIDTGIATCCNNDHGISPNGKQLVISHNLDCQGEQSTIYVLPVKGGTPRRITELFPSYWHGWSPDGNTLAYVARRNGDYDIYTIPVEGGEETRLTDSPGLDDGPDYSPDGKYIYFNSVRTGTMEIWRMDADGGNQVQLTDDDYQNWFPHPDPTGRYIVFITYLDKIDPGSHPPDKNVVLRLMDLQNGAIRELCRFTGGQGTINVPSWAPDGKRFAFVTYKVR